MARLIDKIEFEAVITLLTGLHIGASSENAEIGGVDKPIIRHKKDGQPYLPGSSIKGKIRCLLEQRRGAVKVGDNDEVNNLFGFSGKNLPSKILVRDSNLTPESEKVLREKYSTDLPYSEIKFENSIDRVAGKASNPRQIERIPAGAQFKAAFVINIWENDDKPKHISLFKEGIQLLEADYLGGNGTRGYGHVKIDLSEPKSLI